MRRAQRKVSSKVKAEGPRRTSNLPFLERREGVCLVHGGDRSLGWLSAAQELQSEWVGWSSGLVSRDQARRGCAPSERPGHMGMAVEGGGADLHVQALGKKN